MPAHKKPYAVHPILTLVLKKLRRRGKRENHFDNSIFNERSTTGFRLKEKTRERTMSKSHIFIFQEESLLAFPHPLPAGKT
ncbi:MAG: hypothetical protein AMS15_04870 [Planctomycetes bacterium DG_23]|nr:MAG: hypothetical protein AMS15_04870 [Planctomycetes bacterium DG_23]